MKNWQSQGRDHFWPKVIIYKLSKGLSGDAICQIAQLMAIRFQRRIIFKFFLWKTDKPWKKGMSVWYKLISGTISTWATCPGLFSFKCQLGQRYIISLCLWLGRILNGMTQLNAIFVFSNSYVRRDKYRTLPSFLRLPSVRSPSRN